MKNMFRKIILLLMCGVFGDTGEVKTVSVMEGDSLTLHTDTDIQRDDVIELLWRFGEAGSLKLIVQMKENKITNFDFTDGRFRDRLQISDSKSGSLTIKNMRLKHSGRYEAEISTSSGSTYKRFRVTVKESLDTEAGTDDVKTESVTEGESVPLHTDTELQTDDLILWRFGDKGVLIAKGDKENNKISYDDEGRFKDRLQLDDHTGSLTITNSRISDSGVYKLKISSSIRQTKYKIFSVSVRDAGLSAGEIAGICVFILLVIAAAAGVIFYRRYQKMSEEMKLQDNKKTETVVKGDSVTLSNDTDIQSDDKDKEWRFEETPIAKIKKKEKIYTNVQRFRGRLKLNDQTGDLIIRDIMPEDAGDYKLKIITSGGTLQSLFMKLIGKGTSESWFRVNVSDNMKTVSVMEGCPLSLSTGVTDIQSDDVMQWRFRETLIAEIKRKEMKIFTDDDDVQRFRHRLMLDDQTGDLIIRDIRHEHTGLYKLKTITSRGTSESLFRVNVRERMISAWSGDSLILNSGATEVQSDDVILWRFGAEDRQIAQIIGTKKHVLSDYSKRFGGRLKVDSKTGSLTITDITTEDTGDYNVQIKGRSGDRNRKYNVIISVEVIEGGSVTIQTGGKIQRGDQIQWISKDKVTLVTREIGDSSETEYTDDERFRGRVKMDHQTGDLTITDIRQTDAGEYTLKINRDGEISDRRFSVCVIDNMKTLSVMVGCPLSLSTGVTVIQSDDVIQWRFGETLIAEITRKKMKIYTDDDDVQRFRDRLELKDQTGDLIIRDISTEHTGLYKLKTITSGGTSETRFSVIVLNMKTVTVKETHPLFLPTGVTDIQSDDVIQWRFRGSLIAEIKRKEMKIFTDDFVVKRFRDRLELKDQTGDLTISDIRPEHTGDYELKIKTSGGTSETRFSVIVLMSVMEGCPLTLSTGVTVVQSYDDVIQWRFGETLIAEIKRKEMKFYTDDDDVQRFRDRLELKDQTGDLTIRDSRPEDAGVYKLKTIISGGTSESLINVVIKVADPKGKSVNSAAGCDESSDDKLNMSREYIVNEAPVEVSEKRKKEIAQKVKYLNELSPKEKPGEQPSEEELNRQRAADSLRLFDPENESVAVGIPLLNEEEHSF